MWQWKKKFLMTTKPRGGGVKALVVGLLKKKNFFLQLPLSIHSSVKDIINKNNINSTLNKKRYKQKKKNYPLI